MIEKMILTSECEKCIHGIINENNKSKIIIHCNAKNRNYIYGQRIPCEYKRIDDNYKM